jgi:hypothetical protein
MRRLLLVLLVTSPVAATTFEIDANALIWELFQHQWPEELPA